MHPPSIPLEDLLRQAQLFHQQGALDQAAACYREVLVRKPRHHEALQGLGLTQLQCGRAGEAIAPLERAAQLQPANAAIHTLLGIALQTAGRGAESLQHFERATRLDPQNPEYHYNLGKALRKSDCLAPARKAYESSLRLKPDFAEAFNNLSEVLNALKHPVEALVAADRALALNPGYAEALVNRGAALMTLGRLAEAMTALERAIAIDPDKPLARWDLSVCALTLGQFGTGWRHFGERWNAVMKDSHPGFSQPAWDGRPTEQRILIWGEQGLGDQILFASMFKDAAKLAPAARFAVEPRLASLFRRSFPGLYFCTPEEAVAAEDFDRYVCMGDLFGILRPNAERFIANREAYLCSAPPRHRSLRQTLAPSGGIVCGLSWLSKNEKFGGQKSLALAGLSQALAGCNAVYVDLQYGDTGTERAAVRAAGGIDVLREASVDNHNDIDGLAALVDACDVIVTISNTTAHLAGALGKRVFLMLPFAGGLFWYWQTGREDALCYPNVRIFRQPREGDWTSVLAQVRDALAALPPPAR